MEAMYSGSKIEELWWADPTIDSRVPAIKVTPGTIFTTKTTKIAEHGGFANEERHVALVVAGAGVPVRHIIDPVATTQVAPTILSILGLDAAQLDAVQMEGTAVLPGFAAPSECGAAMTRKLMAHT
jgi:hypothetical protein